MTTITISKKEYQKVFEKALRYDYLRHLFEKDTFSPPPTRDRKMILKEFGKTKKYNQKFLDSLERGMKRSSYFK